MEEYLKSWQAEVDEIEKVKSDYEDAHAREDALLCRFMAEIKEGKIDDINKARAIANIISKTEDISFPRYCA